MELFFHIPESFQYMQCFHQEANTNRKRQKGLKGQLNFLWATNKGMRMKEEEQETGFVELDSFQSLFCT